MRRETEVTIRREGRDKDKTFTLREMPAAQAEEWFMRAMMLLARSGAEVPSDLFQQGAMAFAAIGIGAALTGLGKAPWGEVKPLLDDMMRCVVAISSPSGVPVTNHAQVMAQIEEVHTLIQLREEVLSLHLGFSLAARLSAFRDMAAAMMAANGPTTSTSPEASESSSEVD